MSEFPSVLRIRTLNGNNGFYIQPSTAPPFNAAGDMNGDGFDDIIMGSYTSAPAGSQSGASFVIFGSSSMSSAQFELASLDGSNGFQISGVHFNDFLGVAVTSAGDFNGDGFGDVLVGASGADPNGPYSGSAYVVFGNAYGFPPEFSVSNLNGSNGFRIDGETAFDQVGASIAPAGDVNGDGFDDVILGAGYSEDKSYVVFGNNEGFTPSLNLSTLDGTNGFQINGVSRVAFAGDINGDGLDDICVGAVYVIFGKTSGFSKEIELTGLDGVSGFQISDKYSGYDLGSSFSSAGDVNGDGFADLIIGALHAEGDFLKGAAYVIFGKGSGFSANIDVSTLDGTNGFRITSSERDYIGYSVSSAGDVNGDGFDDLIVGAPWAAPDNKYAAGAAYVVFASSNGFEHEIPVATLDGNNGFAIYGKNGSSLGGLVAEGGDINGDGFDDLLVNGDKHYVIFGHRALEAVTRIGTSIDNTINGGRGADTIRGLAGDDHLIGWENTDYMFGGTGNDRLGGRAGADILVGGAGRDVLIGGFGADVFRFTEVSQSLPAIAEADEIRDFTHLRDQIDVSALGDFNFIGTNHFSEPGEVRVAQVGEDAVVRINTVGTGTPEMSIVLRNVSASTLTADDFIV